MTATTSSSTASSSRGLLGALKQRLGLSRRQPVARPVDQDFSMAVPFGYDAGASLPSQRIAVVCHMFHPDLAAEIAQHLAHIRHPVNLFFSTDTVEKKADLEAAFAHWTSGTLDVRRAPNRGRDIAPKFITFRDVYAQHDLVLFLHSKKSPHLSDGTSWREYLLETLLGSPEIVDSILEAFAATSPGGSQVGMILPQHYTGVREMIEWGSNFEQASSLATKMGIALSEHAPLDLPSGSMFWARCSALSLILDLDLTLADFPEEAGQIDGTLAHALERLLLFACERAGFNWVKIARKRFFPDIETVVPIHGRDDLQRFVAEHSFRLCTS